MPEESRKRREPANRMGHCSDGERGCGRITVGKRCFIVSFAPDLPHKRFSTEVCRFELAGRTLIVTETENQRGAKEDISGDEIAGRLTGRELEIAVLVERLRSSCIMFGGDDFKMSAKASNTLGKPANSVRSDTALAQGCATKNIAFKLQISEWTVSTYLRRIFAKLDVDSRAAMVYRCAALIDRVSAA